MKNALVTGAARRLGRAMALDLADRGYNVAVHYHGSSQDADAVVGEIRSKGLQAIALKADLTQEGDVLPLVELAVQALGGPLTVLINNASIFEYDNFETATRNSWDRHIESNLRAPFVLSQEFARQCPPETQDENGEPVAAGLIVNMVDQRVRKLTPEFSSYTIAKMGLWAMTQTAARAFAPRIRVNAIGPGPTLQGERQSQAHFQNQRQATVLGRGANPKDITAALGYFVESPAITGQLLCVDGGQHLGWVTPDIQGPE